jgi:hypothetical protein
MRLNLNNLWSAMSPAKLCSVLALFYSIVIRNANAIEDPIFNIKGDDKIELILEKMGAPKNIHLPYSFKKDSTEINISETSDTEKIISIEFNPSKTFLVNQKDLFEKIESTNTGDRIHENIILGDPKNGRIWKLTNELKISELNLVKPWVSKSKMLSLKEILNGLETVKLKKIPKSMEHKK